MFLNSLLNKPIIFRKITQHVCIGVGISKKNGSIKYLICLHEKQQTEFALHYTNVVSITNSGIVLSSLRSAIVKNAYILKIGLPVYSVQGVFVGNLDDAVFRQGSLSTLIIQNQTYSFARIRGVLDAILLSTLPVYPLGQRVPAHHESKTNLVTKNTLKKAIDDKKLVSFTLSLPPFNHDINLL